MKTKWREDEVPYFCWDRPRTVAQVREALQTARGAERLRLTAWIMREAAFADVWEFLSPHEVWAEFGDLERRLGRRRGFWRYILKTWHELGRI